MPVIMNPVDLLNQVSDYAERKRPQSNIQDATFFYLKTPTSNPYSNTVGDWGKTMGDGNGKINISNLSWTETNAPGQGHTVQNAFNVTNDTVTSWPSGSGSYDNEIGGYVLNRESKHWKTIFSAYKESIKEQLSIADVQESDVQYIILKPFKVSRYNITNGSYHVDCQVEVKGYKFATATFNLWDDEADAYKFYSAKDYKVGSPVEFPREMNKTGYTFSGWYLDEGRTQPVGDSYTINDNVDFYAKYEKEQLPTPKTYTVIFDANGGAWDQNVTIDGYTFNDVANKTMATNSTLLASDTISDVTHPKKENAVFKGWAASPTATADEAILAFSYESPFTVAKLKEWTEATGATITLYAIWDESPITYKYTIIQHFMNEKGKQDGEPSVNPTGTAAKDTLISNLIPSNLISADTRYSFNGKEYLYENAKVDTENYTGNETLQADNTQIHLYYYLDSWKDGKGNNPDSKTDGDGIPDYKQILVEYHAIPETEGTVTPAVEVHTLDANKTPITLDGSKAEKVANSNFVFAYWISGNVDNSKTADQIEAGAISYNAQLSDVQVTPEGGETYIYTAIFLKDVVGNPDGPDGIPDI